MTPKERRDRLFKKDRPHIRPVQIYDGSQYHKDIKILWVAYQKEPIYSFPKGLDQEQFAKHVEALSQTRELMIAEDFNDGYPDRGPISLFGVYDFDWKIEPHVYFFKWATPRNILRTIVAFLQYVRHSRKIGCCVVHCLENSKNLFDHVTTYGVLHYVGKIHGGDVRGDEYVYSVKGKRCP